MGMKVVESPLEWVANPHVRALDRSPAVSAILPPGIAQAARSFHRQIPGYRTSPLKGLGNLATMLGLGGIWVKDESVRLGISSFKVLGGSFAIYCQVRRTLGLNHDEHISFAELTAPAMKERLGNLTFATATDGNHGRGVAWAAKALGLKAFIYVHSGTARARIRAIEEFGAHVTVVQGTYDDAVRQVAEDAQREGWQIISDTSWKGYEEIPAWIMQGYTTLFSEAQEQLAAQGLIRPTHLFMQAGVGALAASGIGYYHMLFGRDAPISVVVEPLHADCLLRSARAADGEPHKLDGTLDTIMAGLACGEPSPIAWNILWDCADVFVACPDYVAAKGMRVYGIPLAGDPPVISGESGAVTLGALMFIMESPHGEELRERLRLGPDSQVLLVNSEGNTDPEYFRRVAWEGVNPVPADFLYEPKTGR